MSCSYGPGSQIHALSSTERFLRDAKKAEPSRVCATLMSSQGSFFQTEDPLGGSGFTTGSDTRISINQRITMKNGRLSLCPASFVKLLLVVRHFFLVLNFGLADDQMVIENLPKIQAQLLSNCD